MVEDVSTLRIARGVGLGHRSPGGGDALLQHPRHPVSSPPRGAPTVHFRVGIVRRADADCRERGKLGAHRAGHKAVGIESLAVPPPHPQGVESRTRRSLPLVARRIIGGEPVVPDRGAAAVRHRQALDGETPAGGAQRRLFQLQKLAAFVLHGGDLDAIAIDCQARLAHRKPERTKLVHRFPVVLHGHGDARGYRTIHGLFQHDLVVGIPLPEGNERIEEAHTALLRGTPQRERDAVAGILHRPFGHLKSEIALGDRREGEGRGRRGAQGGHRNLLLFGLGGIADDVLRDLFKRCKYPDVILPMCVLRRLDAVLEPTKKAVLETKKMLDEARITEQRAALCDAAGQAFYNTSKFTLRDLKSRGSQQQLLADFEDYLNGFSPNVQDIIENFKFRNQLSTLSKADAIGTLVNKFLDPDIDLSPAGIDNHSMGMVFEELVRKFNEENNEEAGEHWTPRDAVRLMANLVFLPIEAEIRSGTYLLYDCACGTGGMLTVAEETLTAIAAKRKQQVKSLLYGQEINPETYAVCKADMLLKGEGESADHIVGGAECSDRKSSC